MNFSYEKKYINLKICGIDEAGRGPLAGPVVVAGVILKNPLKLFLEKDSKGLSFKKRLMYFKYILKESENFHIEIIDNEDIDKLNIYRATLKGANKVHQKLNPQISLTDALKLETKNHIAITKGDIKSQSIAAASILAKVTRDFIMIFIDKFFPEYCFKKHKGYPTKLHKKIVQEIGITPFHRKSFSNIKNCSLNTKNFHTFYFLKKENREKLYENVLKLLLKVYQVPR